MSDDEGEGKRAREGSGGKGKRERGEGRAERAGEGREGGAKRRASPRGKARQVATDGTSSDLLVPG